MKKSTKNILRVVISILYIIWGITAPLTAIKAILAFDLSAIIGAAVGILMLLAGIFALMGIKSAKCKLFGAIIFVGAVASFVLSLIGGGFAWGQIISAVLAWLFITCV